VLTEYAVSSTETDDSTDFEEEGMVAVATRVPAEIRHELRTIAYEHSTVSDDVTISDVLRVAIAEYLEEDDVEDDEE
jgi:hypothetical protein